MRKQFGRFPSGCFALGRKPLTGARASSFLQKIPSGSGWCSRFDVQSALEEEERSTLFQIKRLRERQGT